jgi:hypothetical protein
MSFMESEVRWKEKAVWAVVAAGLTLALGKAPARAMGYAEAQTASGSIAVKSIGTVQAVSGKTIRIKTDSGSQVRIVLQSSTRMLRVEPGQKTLSGAAPLAIGDLQVGDRVLVIGQTAENGKAISAATLIAMKRSAIVTSHEQERNEWQKNGIGGIVKSVDPATNTITVGVSIGGVNKPVTVHTLLNTVVLRYAPGSIQFNDAKPAQFAQIQPGDQLRARGTFNSDRSQLTAAEVVFGSFRNIAGRVTDIDPSGDTVTVMDLLTKRPVVVKVTPESEQRHLPAQEAQTIAASVKAPAPLAQNASGGQAPAQALSSSKPPGLKSASGQGSVEKPVDFNQILGRLPAVTLAVLHKGSVVMIVSAEGPAPGALTAIKLVSGVAPILRAWPAGNQAQMMQSLWSGFGSTGGGAQQSGESGQSTPSH